MTIGRLPLLTLLLLALLPAPPAAWAQVDVNEDSEFDAADLVTLVLRIDEDPTTLSVRRRLDMDRNGVLDEVDPFHLGRVLVGLTDYLPGFFLNEETGGNVIYTNQDEVTVGYDVFEVSGPYRITAGTTQTLTTGSGEGSGSVTVGGFEPGLNLISLVLWDEDAGTSVGKLLEIRRDLVAPALRLESPVTDQVVQSLSVEVSGQVVDELSPVSVWVNGKPMAIDPDGRFNGTVTFKVGGPRRVQAVAGDAAGNLTTDDVFFELYVSPPKTMAVGGARVDFPTGAICRNGERAEIDHETNQAIRDLLGPGSSLIVSDVPAGGLTTGVIVLPNAIFTSVETDNVMETGLTGAEPIPMFANTPLISLENVTNATNDMPIWIFQIIPDTDGDGFPELTVASRAKVAEDGPLAGRVVPIDPEEGEALPGVFNPEIPTFDEGTVQQIAGLASVQRMLRRLEAGKGPSTPGGGTFRATLWCCGGAATATAGGKVECGTVDLARVQEQLDAHEVEMELLEIAIDARWMTISNAENERLDAANDLFGTFGSSGIVSVTQGKLFACAGHLLTGGTVNAAQAAVETISSTLDAAQDLRAAINAEPDRPPEEYFLRYSNIVTNYFGNRAFIRGMKATDLRTFTSSLQKVTFWKSVSNYLGPLSAIYDCGKVVTGILSGIGNWRLLNQKNAEQDADTAMYNFHKAQFDRLSDCRRHLLASMSGNEPVEPVLAADRWLHSRLQAPETVEPRLQAMHDFILESDGVDQAFLGFVGENVAMGETGPADNAAIATMLEELIGLVEDDLDLYDRREVLADGIEAWNEYSALSAVSPPRYLADLEVVRQANARTFAARGALGGAGLTFESQGSPFTSISRPDGRFTHFIFSSLSSDPIGTPNRMAYFQGRDWALSGQADEGLYSGSLNGTMETIAFPFTPFSTVEFDHLVDVGTIRLDVTVTDPGTQAPEVSITFPPADFQVPAGFPLRVETSSTDDVAVLGVDIGVDGESRIGLPGGLGRGVAPIGETLGNATLTATAIDAADLTDSDQVTIEIVDAAGAFVVQPALVRLEPTETQQFEAMYFGKPATGVTWKVNGFEGGVADMVGTVSGDGLYDPGTADFGGVAAAIVQVEAELDAFPGMAARARVLIVDSRDVIATPLAFSYPAPGAPGGLLTSRPIAFSYPAPAAPGGLLVSRPFAFSFPAPAAPGGLQVTRPIAFERQ